MNSPNLTEMIATTQRNRAGKLADNVTDNAKLLKRLKQKGNVRLVSGGRTLVKELDYAENGTFMYYSGYQPFDISPSDVITAAEFEIKQAVASVSISGLEMIQNAGKEQVIDLLEARIKNCERTIMNNMSVGVYSDGTGSGGKQIGGLQHLVADAGTGTVGGINSSTYSFWQNITFDCSDAGAAASASNIQSYMNRVWVQVVRGADRPDLIVADNNYFRFYLESLQGMQQIVTVSGNSVLGDDVLKFMGADVVLDGGQGGDAPTDHMYFLNTNYLFFETFKGRNFEPLETRFSVNQDAEVRPVVWAGNMTCSNRSLQAVMKA